MIKFKKKDIKIMEIILGKNDFYKLKEYVEDNMSNYYMFSDFFDVDINKIKESDILPLLGIPKKDLNGYDYMRMKKD